MDKIILQKRTKDLALSVFRLVDDLPQSASVNVISYQILKSSSSIAANYRAACRAKSKNDFLNKLKIVEEETDETLFWLEMIQELRLAEAEKLYLIMKETKEILAIITSAVITTRNNLLEKKAG